MLALPGVVREEQSAVHAPDMRVSCAPHVSSVMVRMGRAWLVTSCTPARARRLSRRRTATGVTPGAHRVSHPGDRAQQLAPGVRHAQRLRQVRAAEGPEVDDLRGSC